MYKIKNNLFFFLVIITLAVLAIDLMDSVSAVDITINQNTPGGLKKAIENAGNGDTIYLENGVYYSVNNNLENGVYTGTNNIKKWDTMKNHAYVSIDKDISISGKGDDVVIDAKGIGTIFDIKDNAKVTLKNLKLINGNGNIKGYHFNGGAIDNRGSLSVTGCTFINNRGCSSGGAIYNLGSLSVSGCTFTNNQANIDGGAIDSSGNLSVSACTFNNNQAAGGGAVHVHVYGSLSLSGCTFTNNKADFGGAISGYPFYASGCTFTNNQAKSQGGAINSVNSTISSSTFINNKAGQRGGAIFSGNNNRLNSVTFKNNIAGNKYNAIYSEGSIYKNKVTITPAENSVVPSTTKKVADLKIAKVEKKGNYRYVTIKNIGKKATGGKFYLGVYDGKTQIQKILVNNLGVGKSTIAKVSIAKKYENKLKTFKADSTNRIKESNEKNNSLKSR